MKLLVAGGIGRGGASTAFHKGATVKVMPCGPSDLFPRELQSSDTRGPHRGPQPSLAAFDGLDEVRDLVVYEPPFLHESGHLLDRVDDRRVIATTELPGDGWIAEVGELPEDVHADLA